MDAVVNRSRELNKDAERLKRIRSYQQAYSEETGFIPKRMESASWYQRLILPFCFLGLAGLVYVLYWAQRHL